MDANNRMHQINGQTLSVSKQQRAQMKQQTPCVIWLTGFSGAGKSSVANAVDRKLVALGQHTYLLDGDNVRHGLCSDLNFSADHRDENIRRVGEVAQLMSDAGLIVICAFISPFRQARDAIRASLNNEGFIEVFLDVPISECERRDSKGLYKKARAGELLDFTGIDSPYEAPTHPEIIIKNYNDSIESAAKQVIAYLMAHGYIDR